MERLLTRDEFRHAVFKRDGYRCVICGEPAILDQDGEPTNLDSHHIIERRLFTSPDLFGGYIVQNGASLCQKHHIMAEETTLGCDEIRAACGIETIILPEHLYGDYEYDKWGNIILPNQQRLKGDLFADESVQKILKQGGVLGLFSKYIKYPRSYHLPWSHLGKDDRKMSGGELDGKNVIGTLKLDGENTTMYNDFMHARSLNSDSHPTRNWVKGLWGRINYLIDDSMRVCGENLYTVHTVRYEDLESYFYVFSIWDDLTCLSWKDTKDFATIMGLQMVPVFYEGPYDEEGIKKAFEPHSKFHEGYVVRNADEYKYGEFRRNLGKYVRPEFKQALNQSHGHWISKKIEVNGLRK